MVTRFICGGYDRMSSSELRPLLDSGGGGLDATTFPHYASHQWIETREWSLHKLMSALCSKGDSSVMKSLFF